MCVYINVCECACVCACVRRCMHACVLYHICTLLLISCRVKDSRGWELMFTTPCLDRPPQKIAVNAKVIGNGLETVGILHRYMCVSNNNNNNNNNNNSECSIRMHFILEHCFCVSYSTVAQCISYYVYRNSKSSILNLIDYPSSHGAYKLVCEI